MTQLKTRAIWALCIWSLVMIGLCVVFFSNGGPATFLEGEQRVTLTRAFFTGGFIAYFTVLYLTRRGKTSIVKDERDELIQKRSMATGFYVLLFYVFFFCMFLYFYSPLYLYRPAHFRHLIRVDHIHYTDHRLGIHLLTFLRFYSWKDIYNLPDGIFLQS